MVVKNYPESDGEVEYHDEIHEALHRDARVDYTKPIIRYLFINTG